MATPEKPTSPTIKFLSLFRYANRTDVALNMFGMLCAVASGLLYPFTTVVLGAVIDDFGKWQIAPGILITADQLAKTTADKSLDFVYLAVLELITTYFAVATFVHTGERQVHIIREKYLKAVVRQDITWFDNVGAGEVTTRLTSDTLLIQDAISEKVSLALSHVATFISGFGIGFYRSWKLTLVLLAVIPLIIVSSAVTNVISGKYQSQILQKYSQAGTLAEEAIAAVRTVIAFNAQDKIACNYNENITGARESGIRKETATGMGLGFLFAFIYCGYSLTFYYGYQLLTAGEITSGTVVNVFFAVLIGSFTLGEIAPEMQAFALGRSAGANVFETIDRVPGIDPYNHNGDVIPSDELKGRIELNNVEFFYPARPNVKVLNGFTLTIQPGTTVALVGQSGSGKSTIIQLVERFYDPAAGTVTLDGRPLTSLNLNWLRQNIGLVQQEPILFEGTVADNVAYGIRQSDMSNEQRLSKVMEACKQANAHDFITKLPQKYDTQVGARGLLLSGGQKQRIAIARAIINNPHILLLDEATAALDSKSEAIVQKTLDEVSKSHTTIVVAHRLSTVKNADLIVVMKSGNVVERGTHVSLIEMNGYYAKLVHAQKLDDASSANPSEVELDIKGVPSPSLISSQAENGMVKIDISPDTGAPGSDMSTWEIIRTVFEFNKPELKYTIPGLISAIGAGMVYPVFAIIFSSIIEVFASPGPNLEHDTKMYSLAFVIIAVATLFVTFLQFAMFGFASALLTERLRKLVFSAILGQEVAFFDDEKNSTGVLTSKLSTDAQNIQGASGSTVGSLLQVITNVFGGIIIGLAYGWKLALVTVTSLPLLIASGSFRLKIMAYYANKNKIAYQKSAQLACEAAGGIKTIQSLTYEQKLCKRYELMLQEPLKDGFKNAWFNSIFYALAQSIGFCVNALVFWYAGRLIAYEGYTIKQMMTVFVAIVFGSMSAGRVLSFAPDLNKAKVSAQSIINLLNRKPSIDHRSDKGKKITHSNIKGAVEFRNVFFKYPQRPNIVVLKNLNLKVEPGQFVALVGPSGSGKSTTIGLLERFYDVISGSVLLDGEDISTLNVASYRDVVGLVSQEPNLFDMTILENILLGMSTKPSQEHIERICRDSSIHDFIMTLPDGYKSRVGGKGSQLSGGQKQRIAIARALIRDPKILLLDEATSALDPEAEKVVQDALNTAMKGRTTIAIAHRLSSIQHADLIYVISDGVVAESGNHSQLYNQKGIYHDLVNQQTLHGGA
uniref:Bile salt export pump n=1 Tax=Spongospora subterranea TaxID=70186 RepID=A0A0H5R5L8_9EUKA|eukprot:CRZ09428.1 hypothetical protein [Spongospora subterranea]